MNTSQTLTHECSVPGCAVRLPSHILMCRAHWRRVPYVFRSQVWAAWENWRCGHIGIAELRAVQDRATATVTPPVPASAEEGGAA